MAMVHKTPAYLWHLPPEEPEKISPGGRPYGVVRQRYLNWACDCACGFAYDPAAPFEQGCMSHGELHEEP